MLYEIIIEGFSPILMHNGYSALDKTLPANLEKAAIAKKKGSNRTEQDELRLRELECLVSFWHDEGIPTIPATAFRACIENAARKFKQGPQVREGLIIDSVLEFDYDTDLGETIEELAKTVQFTVPVVVSRNRILRTRAKFDDWGATFRVEVDPELIDETQLRTWLDVAGRRIGLGDWRPAKSGGSFGRFTVESVDVVKE